MPLLSKKTFKIVVFSLVIIAGLYLLRDINFSNILIGLKKANIFLVICAIFLTGIAYYLRSVRWGLFFSQDSKFKIWTLFEATNISNLVNCLLPARLGEGAKFFFLNWLEKARQGSIVAAMLWDRLLDGCVLLIALSLFLKISDRDLPKWVAGTVDQLLPLLLALLILIILISLMSKKIAHYFEKLSFVPAKYKLSIYNNLMQLDFEDSLWKKTRIFFLALIFSIIIWAVELYIIVILGSAMGISFSLADGLLMLVLITCSTLAPSAPGYLGAIQLASIVGFKMMGLSEEDALTYSLLYQVLIYLPAVPMGFLHLAKYGINLQTFKKKLS